jgi:hypothetical protein
MLRFLSVKSARSSFFLSLLLVTSLLACSKKKTDVAARNPDSGVAVDAVPAASETDELWGQAAELEPGELARLAAREGVEGLIEGTEDQPKRMRIALAALQFAPALRAIPFLAAALEEGGSNAAIAADTLTVLASVPRRAEDAEDAEEFRAGCDALQKYASSASKPNALRILAIDALRMLSARGCVKAEAIPTDLDPH